MEAENGFNMGRSAEITRDELKFFKFIDRLRNRFSDLFSQLLRVQLILKGIIKEEDWVDMRDRIRYIWAKDSHFMELKNSEVLRDRFELAAQAEEYVGKYISKEYLRKSILQQTSEQVEALDKQMDLEKAEEEPEDDFEGDADEHF